MSIGASIGTSLEKLSLDPATSRDMARALDAQWRWAALEWQALTYFAIKTTPSVDQNPSETKEPTLPGILP